MNITMNNTNIGDADKNLAVSKEIKGVELKFYHARRAPFHIYGLLPGNEGEPFRRVPYGVAEKTNAGVLRLHTNTAGGRVRFKTDSACVAIRAVMPKKCLMPHMPFLGSAGFDLYVKEGERNLYKGSFIPPVDRTDSYESLIEFGSREMRDIIIHFPLYDGVNELLIGVESEALVEKGGIYDSELPIIYYGSSITQGGCASRPGNAYTNIITRDLNLDHINLGFSGSGRGEQVMAEYIADQPMSLFFFDYDHNAPDAEYLAKTHEAFFLTVREKHTELPVIMASETDTPKTPQKAEDISRRRDVILRTYANAVKRGDNRVMFIDGAEVFREAYKLGVAADSCTVDGIHPNDLGFACMAKVFGDAVKLNLKHMIQRGVQID